MSLTMENVRHFLSPYYVANTLMILAYVPVRFHWFEHGLSKYTRLEDLDDVYKWESQCSGMILFVLAVKSLRLQLTLDVLLADVFLYIKAGILTVTFMVDPRVCVYFGIIFLLAYLMAPQPYRDFLGQHKTELLNLQSFVDSVTNGSSDTKWLVLYFTPGKVGRQINTVFASLSLSYADKQLNFGRVNVHSSPELAASQNIQAKASFYGATLIMYRHGKEVLRHPAQASTDPVIMSADNIAMVFELDKNEARESAASRGDKRKH